MSDPFWDPTIRDWFFDKFDIDEDMVPLPVGLSGSGPFDLGELEQFLVRIGLDAEPIADAPGEHEVIIVGRADWSSDILVEAIRARFDVSTKVYTQEMFLSYLLAEDDPFDHPELLDAFGFEHPAIDFVRSCPDLEWFRWPNAEADPVIVDMDFPGGFEPLWDSPSVGLLSVAGYHTGKTGIGDARERHRVLGAVIEAKNLRTRFDVHKIELDPARVDQYLDQWGPANSATRVRRVAESIAAFCRNERRRNATGALDLSIGHREEDLAWLKATFYDRHRWSRGGWWPSTHP